MGRKKKKVCISFRSQSSLQIELSIPHPQVPLKRKKCIWWICTFQRTIITFLAFLPRPLFFSYEICLLLELDIRPKQKRLAEGKIHVSQWLWKWHQQKIYRYKLVYKQRVQMLPELDWIVWSNHIKWKYMWRLWSWIKVKILYELFSEHRSHYISFS